ncbi:hypothetical protein ABZT47_13045 [Sphaerisporangium sp. NPDC005289]|uniref:hypothetical protein n=1 Tax=Sphaerisporangium sp. NPDC005289 TaxID=3155247 RepID=UPI0033A4B451
MLSGPDPINDFYDRLNCLVDSKGKGTLPKLQTYSERNSPELRLKANTIRGWLKNRKTVPEWDKIAIILDYFKIVDRREWCELWKGAQEAHAARLSAVAIEIPPPEGAPRGVEPMTGPGIESPPPQEAPPQARGPRRRRPVALLSSPRTAVVIVVALLGALALSSVVWLPLLTGDDAGRIRSVEGRPIYRQCSMRDRSILSQPGQVRGGELLGHLRVGERFVVSRRTAYWRFGHVDGDPGRAGWVMSGYLCLVG